MRQPNNLNFLSVGDVGALALREDMNFDELTLPQEALNQALHKAIGKSFVSVSSGVEQLSKLLQRGASVTYRNSRGRNAIEEVILRYPSNLDKRADGSAILLTAIIDNAKTAHGKAYQDSDGLASYSDALQWVIENKSDDFGVTLGADCTLAKKLVAADAHIKTSCGYDSILHTLLSRLSSGSRQKQDTMLEMLQVVSKTANISWVLQHRGQSGLTPIAWINIYPSIHTASAIKKMLAPGYVDDAEIQQRNIFRVRYIIRYDENAALSLKKEFDDEIPLYQDGYPEHNAFYLALIKPLVSLDLIVLLSQSQHAELALAQKMDDTTSILQWATEKHPQLARILQKPDEPTIQAVRQYFRSQPLIGLCQSVLQATSKSTQEGKKQQFLIERFAEIQEASPEQQQALIAYFLCVVMTSRQVVESYLQAQQQQAENENSDAEEAASVASGPVALAVQDDTASDTVSVTATTSTQAKLIGFFRLQQLHKLKDMVVSVIPGSDGDKPFPPFPQEKMSETTSGKKMLELLQRDKSLQKVLLVHDEASSSSSRAAASLSYVEVYANLWQQQDDAAQISAKALAAEATTPSAPEKPLYPS